MRRGRRPGTWRHGVAALGASALLLASAAPANADPEIEGKPTDKRRVPGRRGADGHRAMGGRLADVDVAELPGRRASELLGHRGRQRQLVRRCARRRTKAPASPTGRPRQRRRQRRERPGRVRRHAEDRRGAGGSPRAEPRSTAATLGATAAAGSATAAGRATAPGPAPQATGVRPWEHGDGATARRHDAHRPGRDRRHGDEPDDASVPRRADSGARDQRRRTGHGLDRPRTKAGAYRRAVFARRVSAAPVYDGR